MAANKYQIKEELLKDYRNK